MFYLEAAEARWLDKHQAQKNSNRKSHLFMFTTPCVNFFISMRPKLLTIKA